MAATAALVIATITVPESRASTPSVQGTGAAARMTAEAGYGGTYAPGKPVPLRIRVEADRLVRGRLEVSRRDLPRGSTSSLAVEIPGGSAKQYRMVVPSDDTGGSFAGLDLTVRLVEGDRILGSTPARARSAPEEDMVGVLPGALAGQPLPGATTLAVDAGTARFAALDDEDLEHAPGSLGPLSAVAVAGDELGRMSSSARNGVLRWVASGGRLLVDAPPGTAVPGLPGDWKSSSPRVGAGRGEVVFTDGAMAAGRWPGLIEPAVRRFGSARQEFFGSLGNVLAADAQLRVPQLGWLFGFLALYVIVAGPLTFTVLRRRGQSERAWVAIPLVALVFSTASYLAGSDLRRRATLAHATILESSGGQASATTFLGAASRHGGTTSVRAAPGWVLDEYRSEAGATHGLALASTERGPVGRLALDAGQFAVVRGTGPVNLAGGLEVTATSNADGTASGTVRNRTPFSLRHVVVLVGDTGTVVGDLGTGAETAWTMRTNRNAREPFPPVEARLWPEAWGADALEDDTPSLPLWSEAPPGLAPGTRTTGTAVAAGWTDDYRPELSVDGRKRARRGRTVVTSTSPVLAADGRFGDLAVRADLVVGRMVPAGPASHVVESPSTLRFLLPGPVDSSSVRLDLPVTTSAEVWTNVGWQTVHVGSDDLQHGGGGQDPSVGFGLAPPPVRPPQAMDLPARPIGPASQPVGPLQPPDRVVPPRAVIAQPQAAVRQPGGGASGVTTVSLPPGAVHSDAVFVRVRSPMAQLNVHELTVRQVLA